jgi:opacity protein-like surface antigen
MIALLGRFGAMTERARLMRWVLGVAIVCALAPRAFADDLDVLRGTQTVGPATFTRWSGFYFGAHYGYANENGDFSKATAPLVSESLSQTDIESIITPSSWSVLSKGSASANGIGGFVGYNTQWQDVVIGIEANYTHSPITAVGTSAPILGRVSTAGSNEYSVSLVGTGTLTITDYGSLRARGGWVFDNIFMPYGFVGLALGRGSYAVTSDVFGQQNLATAGPPAIPCTAGTGSCIDYDFTNSAAGQGVLMYGFSVGGGVDIALTSNIFVRGEVEFMQFAPIANITASITSAKVGAGLKF